MLVRQQYIFIMHILRQAPIALRVFYIREDLFSLWSSLSQSPREGRRVIHQKNEVLGILKWISLFNGSKNLTNDNRNYIGRTELLTI